MKHIIKFFVFLLFFSIWPATIQAQDDPFFAYDNSTITNVSPAGEVTDTPLCFNIFNKAPYSIRGSVMSDKYVTKDGITAHHRSNFRLDTGEYTEFCSTGPFYEGRRLELTLRTLVPIFSCKTRADQNVTVFGHHREEEGGTETWATCQ